MSTAKNIRMVIFYNKQLKTPAANGEIGFKDLIFHGQITRWQVRNPKRQKDVSTGPALRNECMLSWGCYCSPMTCIIKFRCRG